MTTDNLPDLILVAVLTYAGAGAIFAIAFTLRGAAAIDPIIKDTPLRTRILFIPGAVAVWPVLLLKWMRSGAAA